MSVAPELPTEPYERRYIGSQYFKSRQPVIEKAPTSCRCGGDTAFVARTGALITMLGCVCHHDVEVTLQPSTETWEVRVYYVAHADRPDAAYALARRAVACKGWRWLRGMLRHDDYRYLGGGVWARWSDTAAVVTALHMPDQLPDLTDPATLGCLLALVREAWGNPTATTAVTRMGDGSRGWVVDCWSTQSPLGWFGVTEAHSLVAALEAAP